MARSAAALNTSARPREGLWVDANAYVTSYKFHAIVFVTCTVHARAIVLVACVLVDVLVMYMYLHVGYMYMYWYVIEYKYFVA